MTLDTHNWSSSAHQELHKIVRDEIFPIVNQVDARVQNFEIQFLKEAAKFVVDFKSLAKEANESLAKHKALELEIERLLRTVVSQDIMSVVQNNSVDETSNLQTELESYNDMHQKIERLQAQLGDLKGKSMDTSCVLDTFNPLSRKLENENVELEFQVSDQNDTACGTSANTKFSKQSILGKPSKVGVDNTKTRRPKPRSNTKNDRVPYASKSSHCKNKEVEVEEHHKKLLLSRNKKHMSSECNNVKLATQNVKSKVVCVMCKKCLIYLNHDVCLLNYVNGMTFRGCSKHMTGNLKLLINFIWKFLGTVHFGNDHVVAILGFSDLQWGSILIIRVYFIKGLGHNLFSVGQFCDSDLEVAFRRNTRFIRNLEGVDLISGNQTTNLYTINLHEMASASPIFLMDRASSTNLPKFKYHKEHLCPSCEQGKSKIASHPPKPVPNSRQRLHLLHMDLCEIATTCFTQNRSIIHHRFNKTPYELINGRKANISFLHVFGALCYPKNDCEDIGKRGAKGDIGFFIGYSVDTCTFRVSGLDLTYAPSTIITQQPTKGELDLLFEAMYNDYIGGQPSAAPKTISAAQVHQVRLTSMTSTSIADTAPTPTNSSSQATNFLNTSQDVDGLNSQQQHAQPQENQAPI
nr:integrase, catalytic region, zinc finger, CCHC-type, peptidase aspartic, catalytic [Tanacetum cinerariifolium]